MHRASLTAIACLVAAAPVGAEPGALGFSFDPPGEAGPDLAVDGAEWVMVLFGAGDAGHLELQAQDLHVEEYETRRPAVTYLDGKGPQAWSPIVQVRNESLSGPFQATAHHGMGTWGSFYAEGSGIRLSTQGQPARLDVKESDRCLPVGREEVGNSTFREDVLCPTGGHAAVVVRAPNEPASFQIEATSLTRIEWHGLGIACAQEACVSGGARDDSGPDAGLLSVRQGRYGYANLQADGMALHANGTAMLVATGGSRISLGVDGWIRLPGFDGACCQDDATLAASGHPVLANLTYLGDGRLGGTLAGDLATARLDETALDPMVLLGYSAGTLAVVGAAAVGLALLKLLGLFSRVSDPLTNARTKQLYEAIQANRGIHALALARLTGWTRAAVRYHARRLADNGLIVARRQGDVVHFFENHGKYDADWKVHALMQEEPLRRLLEHLQAHPGVTRAQAIAQARAWGWSRRTAYHRLQRLTKAGLLAGDAKPNSVLQPMGVPANPG